MGKLIKLSEEVVINLDEISNMNISVMTYRGVKDISKYIDFLKYKEKCYIGTVITSDDEFMNIIRIGSDAFTVDMFASFIDEQVKERISNYIAPIDIFKMDIVLKNGFTSSFKYIDSDKDIIIEPAFNIKYISKDEIEKGNEEYSRIKKIIMDNAL